MSTIYSLPYTLLIEVGEQASESALAALIRTSWFLYEPLNPLLYRLNATREDRGNSCVFWAAETGNLETLKLAYQHGADLSARRPISKDQVLNAGGFSPAICPTPLMAAVASHSHEVLQFLAANGAELNSAGFSYFDFDEKYFRHFDNFMYPLGEALGRVYPSEIAHPGDDEAAAILINHGACMVDVREPALPRAAAQNKLEFVAALLELPGVSVNDGDYLYSGTALHAAARFGHRQMAQLLLGYPGMDPERLDKRGCSAIRYAAKADDLNMMRALLDAGSLTVQTRTRARMHALEWAATEGSPIVLKYLLTLPDVDVSRNNAQGNPILCLAVGSGNREAVSLLLGSPQIDAAAVDDDGATALHWAAETAVDTCNDNDEADPCGIVVDLLDHDTPIDAVNEAGATALRAAVRWGAFQVALQLLYLGARLDVDVNGIDADSQWTLLHDALLPVRDDPESPERADMIAEIARRDPQSIELQSFVGNVAIGSGRGVRFDGTPLLFAALYSGNAALVDLLVDMGANIDAMATRRHVAPAKSRFTIMAALLSHRLSAPYPYKAVDRRSDEAKHNELGRSINAIRALLHNGARIDDPRDQQPVLEFACELALGGSDRLFDTLIMGSTLKNLSPDFAGRLAKHYKCLQVEDWAETRRDYICYRLEAFAGLESGSVEGR